MPWPLLAFAAAVAMGIVVTRWWARRLAGPTWEDWVTAAPVRLAIALPVGLALSFAGIFAISGGMLPGVVRAGLGGIVVGFLAGAHIETTVRWRRYKHATRVSWSRRDDVRRRRSQPRDDP